MSDPAAESTATETEAFDLKSLEGFLDYKFNDPSLLERALTHASLTVSTKGRGRRSKQVDSNNERLEFLGDRVLGVVIAHRLLELYPADAEGRLTDRLVALVKRDTLAEVAGEFELNRWLRLAAGEEGIGGRSNPGILADCLEALIGALFLDGGLDPAQTFIRRHWDSRLRQMRKPPRDPKMALQEWAHAHADQVPDYQLLDRSGPPHAPTFKVAVEIEGKGRELASAGSKRKAEKAAAARLLKQLEEA